MYIGDPQSMVSRSDFPVSAFGLGPFLPAVAHFHSWRKGLLASPLHSLLCSHSFTGTGVGTRCLTPFYRGKGVESVRLREKVGRNESETVGIEVWPLRLSNQAISRLCFLSL